VLTATSLWCKVCIAVPQFSEEMVSMVFAAIISRNLLLDKKSVYWLLRY
jgi:hypothetical protein